MVTSPVKSVPLEISVLLLSLESSQRRHSFALHRFLHDLLHREYLLFHHLCRSFCREQFDLQIFPGDLRLRGLLVGDPLPVDLLSFSSPEWSCSHQHQAESRVIRTHSTVPPLESNEEIQVLRRHDWWTGSKQSHWPEWPVWDNLFTIEQQLHQWTVAQSILQGEPTEADLSTTGDRSKSEADQSTETIGKRSSREAIDLGIV